LIDALNAINVAGGGTSEQFELPALVQLGAVLNYPPTTNVVLMVAKEDSTRYATKKDNRTVYIIAKTI
jgi:hypothetical protein